MQYANWHPTHHLHSGNSDPPLANCRNIVFLFLKSVVILPLHMWSSVMYRLELILHFVKVLLFSLMDLHI
jgi:hypothetical protein